MGDPWSNYTVVTPPVGKFNDACVIAEKEAEPFSPFGVLCHEFGHLLGLPELYAPGGAKHEGIGVWGLMGQGTWLGHGDQPPHPEAWSKARLGWVDVETIDHTTLGVTLPAVTRVPRVVKIPATPGNTQEYYLLENRLREGADAKLPGEGLLVWHVDERVTGFRTAQQNPAHKMLHLVEADGRGDLDRGHAAGGNRGDATDPWSGPPAWRRRAGAGLAHPRRARSGTGPAQPRPAARAAAGAGVRRRRRPAPRGRRRAAQRPGLRNRDAGDGALRRRPVAGRDPELLAARTGDALRRPDGAGGRVAVSVRPRLVPRGAGRLR